MSDERPWDEPNARSAHRPEPGPDDFEILLFGGEGPELMSGQAERNTELLAALTVAARDCGVVPAFLQLPAAPPAPVPAPGAGQRDGAGPEGRGRARDHDVPPFDEAYCLRMGVRTWAGCPLGRIDFLNAVLRLARAYQLGMYVGESTGPGMPPHYRRALAHRPGFADPDSRPDVPRREDPPPQARHRVIDLTARVPVPARTPLDGSLMVTVVGPVDGELADDLARIAMFFDDHRVGCYAASAAPLNRTIVVNFVLAVLPDAPVDTDSFAEILRSGLGSDPVWPARFRPTLLDPVTAP
jgi:hypothetical protein